MGKVPCNEVAPPAYIATVRRLQSRKDAEKRGLTAAIASDQPNAVTFLNAKCGAVEDGAFSKANHEVGSSEDGGHFKSPAQAVFGQVVLLASGCEITANVGCKFRSLIILFDNLESV